MPNTQPTCCPHCPQHCARCRKPPCRSTTIAWQCARLKYIVPVPVGRAMTTSAQPGWVAWRTRYDRLAILVAKLCSSIAIEDVGCTGEVVQPHKARGHGGPCYQEAREQSPQEVAQPANHTRPSHATHCDRPAVQVQSIKLTLLPPAAEPSPRTVSLRHNHTPFEPQELCESYLSSGLPTGQRARLAMLGRGHSTLEAHRVQPNATEYWRNAGRGVTQGVLSCRVA